MPLIIFKVRRLDTEQWRAEVEISYSLYAYYIRRIDKRGVEVVGLENMLC